MMFVAPLVAHGADLPGIRRPDRGSGGVTLPRPVVLVVNLDQPASNAGFKAGALLAQHLSGPEFAALLDARPEQSDAAARQTVDRRQADVAVIIPPDFTAAAAEPAPAATVLPIITPTAPSGSGWCGTANRPSSWC
jgi:hypothetical protein